ncbi:DUF4864 domain-containing protein [Sulfitobacter aestuarii]|uniref:DUF4864 domain-containing protein n=1 Tax=Sulfitobacter aestuarii TaxID=2161676 RepID=A0ABW5U484_9RHOB
MRNGWISGLAGLCLSALLSFAAAAQEGPIEDVIRRQIEAFKADDFATAFEFASPRLQSLFGTPQNFGRMVTEGYPMVWRPAELRFLQLREGDGGFQQLVQIIDAEGRVHLLAYTMEQGADGWRIAAVRILPRPGVAV